MPSNEQWWGGACLGSLSDSNFGSNIRRFCWGAFVDFWVRFNGSPAGLRFVTGGERPRIQYEQKRVMVHEYIQASSLSYLLRFESRDLLSTSLVSPGSVLWGLGRPSHPPKQTFICVPYLHLRLHKIVGWLLLWKALPMWVGFHDALQNCLYLLLASNHRQR